jgi:hypothetical protein
LGLIVARPSKLTDSQWERIEARLLRGEKTADLAREFKITPAAISKRFSRKKNELKLIATRLADVENDFNSLRFAEKQAVRNLADELKAISYHLAGAAKLGAMTAHRLNGIAQQQAERIDDADPLGKSAKELTAVAALTKTANDAAATGMGLLKANQEAVERINREGEQPPAPTQVVFTVADGRKRADA